MLERLNELILAEAKFSVYFVTSTAARTDVFIRSADAVGISLQENVNTRLVFIPWTNISRVIVAS